uniref:Mediator of RNA polymerase II transcription subunit 30 n=1 Tax=Glossina austeni TaxID=7395 RepID=A0A1A9V7B1_GLOAU
MLNYGLQSVVNICKRNNTLQHPSENPIMIKTKICNLGPLRTAEMIRDGEHDFELRGIFIIKGHEKIKFSLLLRTQTTANRDNSTIKKVQDHFRTTQLLFKRMGLIYERWNHGCLGYLQVESLIPFKDKPEHRKALQENQELINSYNFINLTCVDAHFLSDETMQAFQNRDNE